MATPREKKLWLPIAISLGIGVGICLGCWGLRALRFFEPVELKCYDWLLRKQPRDTSTASRVVVIGISEDDIHHPEFQLDYPISDAAMARLLGALFAFEPRAVGVDIFRDKQVPAPSSKDEVTPGRRELQELWKAHRNLFFVAQVGAANTNVPKPPGLPVKQAGHNDFVLDEDGIIRRGVLFLPGVDPDAGGATANYTYLGLWLARYYLAKEQPRILFEPLDPHAPQPRDFVLGKGTFRHLDPTSGPYVSIDSSGTQFFLDWRSPRPDRFRHFSAVDVLSGKVKDEDIRGRVVLLGMTAGSVKDYLTTPLDTGAAPSPAGTRADDGRAATWGVDAHAATVDQFLGMALDGRRPIRFAPPAGQVLWLLGWSVAGALVGMLFRSPLKAGLAVTLGACAIVGIVYLAFVRAAFWLPVVPPVIAWVLAAFAVTAYMSYREKADRLIVMKLFSRHVSRDVADALWRERDQFLAGGRLVAQPLTATVLFTDLKGFSGVSETMSAQELMAWLNELMDALSRDVDDNGGIVNKYIGDAVMAVFGVPRPRLTRDEQARDACNAVRCAVAMRKTLARLNDDWQARGLPRIGMRIGVVTGPLVAGSLGSAERMEYTVIGDTVNTASRLESFDKSLMDPDITGDGCRILIAESTRQLLDGSFRTRSIGILPISGKQEKVAIHGVIGCEAAV